MAKAKPRRHKEQSLQQTVLVFGLPLTLDLVILTHHSLTQK